MSNRDMTLTGMELVDHIHYQNCCHQALSDMDEKHKVHPAATLDAAYAYISTKSAGVPMISMVDESARSDARFWTETASLPELECYTVAAIDRMRGSAFTARQIKRLMGALWRRMAREEKKAFLDWMAEFEARE